MQPEKMFIPATKGAAVGSSSPAAGKPARPFVTGTRTHTVLPSTIFYGRDTMLSSSSLGDSVSQRGEAIGSFTPRGGLDFGHRDSRDTSRMALFPGGREQLNAAWRPPAGLPLPGSNGSTVSCTSDSSGAGSVGRGSNYAEASAAASFYKQRQQQHSSCIFGDGSECASSVARSLPPDQATEADIKLQQRADGGSGRSGSQQHPSQVLADGVRPAGVRTAAWQSHHEQQQQQRKLLETPETVEKPRQQCHQGTSVISMTEPSQQHSAQNYVKETPSLEWPCPDQHMGQQCPPLRQDVASVQQWQPESSEAGISSRPQVTMNVASPNAGSQDSTRGQQDEVELSNNGVMQGEMQHFLPGDPDALLACKPSNTQSLEFQPSAVEFDHPPEGSTASSGDYSPSPASPSTPLPAEHEVDMERRDQQEHQLHRRQMHSSAEEEVVPRTNDLEMPGKPRMAEAFARGASPTPGSPGNSRPRWQPGSEEEDVSSTVRGNRDSLTFPRGARSLDVSSFVPREDPRSSREKQIQALRSTGSVMPVSAAADAAVAAAAAAASFRHHGGIGRRTADRGASDIGFGSGSDGSRAGGQRPPDAHTALYPLSLMGRDSEQKGAGRRVAQRAGCSRLLPLDIAWHSSAASVLGSREALAHGGALYGAVSSPTSNASRDLPSPANSNCSQAAHGQQLTARERLLHQHCTSSVFASEEEGTGEASTRSVRVRPPSSDGAAAPSRVTPLQQCEYGTKDENLQRRSDQLQNPWYSDLFGRHTPKRSPTAARCAAAAALASTAEVEASPGREGEDIQGAGSPSTGNAIFGVDGATLDKLRAHRRKTQLLHAPNAYERFINAMQSDIWSDVGDDGEATTQQRLTRAHLAKETLLQEKHREQRRRQRLKEAVNDGHGKYFHMATSEEARVGEMGKDLDVLGLQMKRALPVKRSIAELHLFGLNPDMTEEDIERLCRTEERGKVEREEFPERGGATAATQSECKAKSSKAGLSKCSLQVKLATDILTSKCKGTGKIILQYLEDDVDVEQVVRRLRDANVGVRQL